MEERHQEDQGGSLSEEMERRQNTKRVDSDLELLHLGIFVGTKNQQI